MKFLTFAFLIVFSKFSFSNTVYTAETLPALIKKAAIWNVQLKSNQLRSDLNGLTTGNLIIEAQIETRNDFNVYRENLSFSSEWKTEILKEAPRINFLDPVTKKLKEGFRGQSVFELMITLPSQGISKLSSDFKVPLLIHFQACNKELCLLPATLQIDVPLVRSEVQALHSTEPANDTFIEKSTAKLKQLLENNQFSWLSFALLFLAGLITAATPCVYPLYPITAGIFSRWTSRSKRRVFILSLSYCIGMTLSYATIGLIAASTGTLFGSFAQNSYFMLFIGLSILISAFMFSGLIPFQAPQFLQKLFMGSEESQQSEQPLSTLIFKSSTMGLGLGVVAAPCVGPVLIALLAWLSTQLSQGTASYTLGFFLLATFGAGMSLPFLILSSLIVRMQNIPRFGRFTPWIKNFGSLLLVLGSLFFIIPALQGLGIWPSQKVETKFHVYNLQTWPRDKWTVVDFRADWCSACLELENETFTHFDVSKLFESKDWDYVSVDLTKQNEENSKIASDWNVIGLPTVLIINPEQFICENLTLNGFEDAKAFKNRLTKASQDCIPKASPSN